MDGPEIGIKSYCLPSLLTVSVAVIDRNRFTYHEHITTSVSQLVAKTKWLKVITFLSFQLFGQPFSYNRLYKYLLSPSKLGQGAVQGPVDRLSPA